MAKKLTPSEYRDQARDLLKKADLEEERRHLKLGRFVAKRLLNEEFNPSDLPKFLEKAREIMK
jgi:hypothetical protein